MEEMRLLAAIKEARNSWDYYLRELAECDGDWRRFNDNQVSLWANNYAASLFLYMEWAGY